MNKSDIVDRVAVETPLTKAAAEAAVSAVFVAIGEALARGENVTIMGFGSFRRKRRGAREGRNPRTGERIAIGASNTVSFKAAKALREYIGK